MAKTYRTLEEFQDAHWATLDEESRQYVAQILARGSTTRRAGLSRQGVAPQIAGEMQWEPEDYFRLMEEEGEVSADQIRPQEYGDIDLGMTARNVTYGKAGDVVSEQTQGTVDMISNLPGTIKKGYDVGVGLTSRGLAGRHLRPRENEAADSALVQLPRQGQQIIDSFRDQFSPAGIQGDPLRALATGSALAPTRMLAGGLRVAGAPRLLQRVTEAADRVTNVTSGDPIALGAESYRGGRSLLRKLREGRGPGFTEKVAREIIPFETEGFGAEHVVPHTREYGGQVVSMMTGAPMRAYAEAMNIAHHPLVRKGRVVPGRTVGQEMQSMQQWTPDKRMNELVLRANRAVDDLDDAASRDYAVGLERLGDQLDVPITRDAYQNFIEAFEEKLEGLDIYLEHIPIENLPAPPKGTLPVPNPIPEVGVSWKGSILKKHLKGRRGQFKNVLRDILNANRESWGAEKTVTLRDVYQMRRDVDQLMGSYTISEAVTRDTRVAFQRTRAVMQEELGTIMPGYDDIMSDYMDKIDLLENLEEHLSLRPHQIKKAGARERKADKGVTVETHAKLSTALDKGDASRAALHQLFLLEKLTGDNSLVPMLITSVTSNIMAVNLVARHAVLGGLVGAGVYEGGLSLDLDLPTMASGMIGGVIGGVSTMLSMNPRFATKWAASDRWRKWKEKNNARVQRAMEFDKNRKGLSGVMVDALDYGWDLGRTLEQLESHLPVLVTDETENKGPLSANKISKASGQ